MSLVRPPNIMDLKEGKPLTLRRGADFCLSIRKVGVDGPSSVRVRALAGMPSMPREPAH